MNRRKIYLLTSMALAITLNYIGANLALFLHLPIYLDMIGTLLLSLLLGPWVGAATAMSSALLSWLTSDAFALFYAPVAMVTALLSGFFLRHNSRAKEIVWKAFCISLPGTALAALITVSLFKGITSSGSSLLVQVLHSLGLNLTASVLLVQMTSDYLDRFISLALVLAVIKNLKIQTSSLFKNYK
ncbi:ECF transporter S component [Streptococcus didelphis]|uniref:ECF transporter S component n=1 Tax=Streptococcus didelphis TaxID=102886 RepID=UPI000477348B|nr:LytS/YhcK type 5TM receptor domain-containing protein [Streptococcus didelphis]